MIEVAIVCAACVGVVGILARSYERVTIMRLEDARARVESSRIDGLETRVATLEGGQTSLSRRVEALQLGARR